MVEASHPVATLHNLIKVIATREGVEERKRKVGFGEPRGSTLLAGRKKNTTLVPLVWFVSME